MFTDFNLLLLLCVMCVCVLLLLSGFCLASHPQDSSLPPSLHQLPEELSVWIAALSVQPVRLRDAF